MANKRARVEEKVFEAIEDITEELGIEASTYPEIHLINKKTEFDDLWLPESKRERFESLKEMGGSWYDDSPPGIFLINPSEEDIAEESSHFLHFRHSRIRYTGRTTRDKFALNILVETIGFFCSKLLIPERENTYPTEPDLFFMTPNDRIKCLNDVMKKYGKIAASEFCLYQQARGLGDRMHYAYLTGDLSMEEFRKLFLCSFRGRDNPFSKLVELKMKYWKSQEYQPKPLKHQKTP